MSENKEQQFAQSTFNDVAPRYDKIAFFKHSAVEVAKLITHESSKTYLDILDVASGTGNVLIEVAKHLPDAHFDAVDISEAMLNVAKAKADAAGIQNIAYHVADITTLDMGKQYDIITCSYALFFLPDPSQTLNVLLQHLKKEGELIFTSFVPDAFEPAKGILLELLEKYGVSDMQKPEDKAWHDLKTHEDIHYLCEMSKVKAHEVVTKPIRYMMSIDAWWALNNDAGFRGHLMQLSQEAYEKLKEDYYQKMQAIASDEGVELIADSHFCVIKK